MRVLHKVFSSLIMFCFKKKKNGPQGQIQVSVTLCNSPSQWLGSLMHGGVNMGLGRLEGGGGLLSFPCDSRKGIFPPLGELEGESWLQFYNRKQEK